MDRLWRWFRRPSTVLIDQTRRTLPDGGSPERLRQVADEEVVPDLRPTSRCDGAVVYERPEQRWTALAANQRVERYDRWSLADRNRRR